MSGFFDWLKGSSESKEKISLDEVDSHLSKLEEDTFSNLYEYAEDIRSKVNSSIEDIKNICRDLGKKEVDEETHPRLKSSISMKKENLVNKGLSTNYVKDIEIDDWESLLKFRKKVFDVLRKFNKASEEAYQRAGSCVGGSCGAPSPSSTMAIVSKGFKSEVSSLNKVLKDVSSNLQRLDEKINSYKEDREKFSKVREDLSNLEEIKDELEEIERKVDNKKGKLSDLMERREELEDEIAKVEDSEEFRKMKEAVDELSELQDDREKLGTKLKSKMNIVKKGMKKYLYNQRTLLGDDKVELIESYLDDPLKALSSDSSLDILEVMGKIKERVEGGNIEFGSDRKDKIIEDLDKLPEDIKKAKDKLDSLSEREEELKDQKNSNRAKEREELSREKEKVKKEINEIESKISELKEERKEKESELESLKKEISNKLERNFNLELGSR